MRHPRTSDFWQRTLSRRAAIKAGASTAAATAIGLGSLGASRTSAAPAVLANGGKMTYWGIITFSEEIDNYQADTIKAWGKQNDLDIEVVMINGNEMNAKVAAAVESGTLPDALDMSLDLGMLLGSSGKFEPLDDVFDQVGEAHGGWIEGVANAVNPDLLGGNRIGVPFGTIGNILFRRTDLLKPAGFDAAPATWQELRDAAEKTTNPPVFGMGFALSNVGDANLTVQMLQAWGGRIADDDGKNCTVKSPETKEFLGWITDAYKANLFPPGVTTWDGAGDNNSYQAGQSVFIANTGSVYIWMEENDKELSDSTAYSAMPAGPAMRVSPFNVNMRAVTKGGEHVDAAKALIAHLAEKDFIDKYYAGSVYGPVLQEQVSYDAFKDPVHAGLADLSQNGTPPAFPDVNNPAYADFNNNFLIPRMVQRVVVDGKSLDDAIDEAQEQGQAIYDKYK